MADDLLHYPNLVEFLAADKMDDGASRKLGTVRILVEGGRLKVCFNDNEADRYAYSTVDSLDALLGDLERLLAGDGIDWRQSKPNGRHR
jgi:hypothetical protein